MCSRKRELRNYKSPKNSPNIIFFHSCKTYNSVPRDKMIAKIQDLEVPWNITMIINSMLENFELNSGLEKIKTKRGLIQGSVLLTILFNLFINDLLDEFQAIGIFTKAYSDDIAWVCSSLEQARNTIDTMKRWWDRNGMKVNETKSDILRILKKKWKNWCNKEFPWYNRSEWISISWNNYKPIHNYLKSKPVSQKQGNTKEEKRRNNKNSSSRHKEQNGVLQHSGNAKIKLRLQSAIWQQRRDRKSLKECHIPMHKDNVWYQRECKNKQRLEVLRIKLQ